MGKLFQEAQTKAEREAWHAQQVVGDAERGLADAQARYDKRAVYVDSLLGVRESALFVEQLGNLAEFRIAVDAHKAELAVCIARERNVKIQCDGAMAAAYARENSKPDWFAE